VRGLEADLAAAHAAGKKLAAEQAEMEAAQGTTDQDIKVPPALLITYADVSDAQHVTEQAAEHAIQHLHRASICRNFNMPWDPSASYVNQSD
jgi:hypothetical protein